MLDWIIDEPLTRVKGESKRANAALRDYALMGAGRALRKLLQNYIERAANVEQAQPPTTRWSTICGWSASLAWQERVVRFDELQQEIEVRDYAARRLVDREARIQVLQAYRGKIIQALQLVDPNNASWNDVTGALRMVTEELRREFGEVDQVVEVREAPPVESPAARLSNEELQAAVANLLAGT
jgi:hypothetical protein